MRDKLKRMFNDEVGAHNWYIAGGAAAFWHIEKHARSVGAQHMNDLEYYESIRKLIYPGDVEGNAVKEVNIENFRNDYGDVIDVGLREMDKKTFDEKKEAMCVEVDGVLVVNIDSIIKLYGTTTDKSKIDKRNTRIALLKIVKKGLGITKQNVEGNKPRGMNLGAEIALRARRG